MNEMEPLSDGEITLRLSKDIPADTTKEWLRALHFDITLPGTAETIGFIDIRLGYTLSLVRFGGHFGYNVKPKWRGRHYAGKACKLLRRIAITETDRYHLRDGCPVDYLQSRKLAFSQNLRMDWSNVD